MMAERTYSVLESAEMLVTGSTATWQRQILKHAQLENFPQLNIY
jgi:hypothetical protein